MADASSRGPNVIHIQGEYARAMADKASKRDRRGPKGVWSLFGEERRTTDAFLASDCVQ